MVPVPLEKLSPMLRQYMEIKAERPETILLIRVGDFFEAYGADATTIATALEITLTGRDISGWDERLPMAGVPYHALDRYLARLVQQGFKVAICDQVEDPKHAKGLVRRAVTRVVTPGTLLEDSLLDARSNNFLVAAILRTPVSGIGVVDVSTGEFLTCELPVNATEADIAAEVARIGPAECLVPENQDTLAEAIAALCPATITRLGMRKLPRTPREDLLRHFGVTTLRGFGCDHFTAGLEAAATLLGYVEETQQGAVPHLKSLAIWSVDDTMALDASARRNLELTAGLLDQSKAKSLLAVLDNTRTSMGGRLLRRWLDAPLLSVGAITERQENIAAFIGASLVRGELRDTLREMSDLERLVARICTGSASPRDLAALGLSLSCLAALRERACQITDPAIAVLASQLHPVGTLARDLQTAIVDEPPLLVRDGGIFKAGYDSELDSLRALRQGGATWIAELEVVERDRTGIKNLKVGYTSVFGYYLEVPRSQLHLVPENYIRKQTTAAGERYFTPELKDMEVKVMGAQENQLSRETELFNALRDTIARDWASSILDRAKVVAQLDVASGLAELAVNNRWCRPDVDDKDVIDIRSGRHPVVEKLAGGIQRFIPNDTLLDSQQTVHVITGPNAAGKSTVLRQVALIVLLAQIGSYVPAQSARIGIVDRIFTRVGAHDDLSSGQSTFMVEMTETAEILNHATNRSLIILDEIGRGTSTYDGLSIAWSVAEYLSTLGAKTLFATHYHLLNDLEKQRSNVKNFRIAVRETDDRILWLRKVLPGGTDKSYGVQVARMAGLPSVVIERAKSILAQLEKSGGAPRIDAIMAPLQMTLFEAAIHPVVEELQALDPNLLSPMDALHLIMRLHTDAKKR